MTISDSIFSTYASSIEHALLGQVRPLEGDLVEQLLHHGVEPTRADVLGALVDDRRKVGDAVNRIGGERQLDPLGFHERRVLLDQRAARLGQDPDELVPAERLELDANRKSTLELRDRDRTAWRRETRRRQ